MITSYFTYKVKIRNEKFISESGREYDNTALISFIDENKKELDFVQVGYIDTQEIYDCIDNGTDINLDHCYVESFSLENYRKKKGLSAEDVINIKSFSAKGAFFESQICTDFSFCDFGEGDLLFSNAHFLNGKASFDSIKIGDGEVDFSYCFFSNGNVDFSNAIFGNGDVSFKNSIFKEGTKDFQYADFGEGSISFANTEFGDGEVSFINANFSKGNVSFKVARFGVGKIDFHFATFAKGDISFERVEFGDGRKDFRKVEFDRGRINFNRADFGTGDITFEACQLPKGRLTFKRTLFGDGNISFELAELDDSDLIFEEVDFGVGNVTFNSARLKKLSLKSCHLDNYFDLRVARCEHIDLSDTIVRDIIDVQPYKSDVDIQNFDILGMRLLGRIDIDWESNKVFDLIAGQEYNTYREKAEQFRILKENYGSIGQYIYEDYAYIQFKRYEQLADLHESVARNKISALWQYPVYFFKMLVFDRIGLYATSPGRVLTSLVIIYFAFSLVHLICPYIFDTGINCIGEDMGFVDKVLTTFYYSLITFTTVGYGDCSPEGFLRFVGSIEGFFGVFMMSYFTVAFARKILR